LCAWWADVAEPLRADADAVAPVDAVAIREGSAQALAPVGPGEGVLAAGVDGARGAGLLSAGRRLGGGGVALVAAAGSAEGRVRAPRLRLVRTRRGSDAVIDAAIGYIVDTIGSQGGRSEGGRV